VLDAERAGLLKSADVASVAEAHALLAAAAISKTAGAVFLPN
jgi:hypothetical protein